MIESNPRNQNRLTPAGKDEVKTIRTDNNQWVSVTEKDGGSIKSQSVEANLMVTIIARLDDIIKLMQHKTEYQRLMSPR